MVQTVKLPKFLRRIRVSARPQSGAGNKTGYNGNRSSGVVEDRSSKRKRIMNAGRWHESLQLAAAVLVGTTEAAKVHAENDAQQRPNVIVILADNRY
jgi:hypothetical protein